MSGLLERADELAALDAVVADLDRDRGRLVLVGGEAGIGKTSLVRVLGARAGGVRALVGACEPLSVPIPLAPLRELAEASGGFDLLALETQDRLRLTSALLGALARVAPVVAVIEDAHWADPTTLDVVRLLARRVEHSRVAVIVTYRDDEVGANPQLEQLLGDLVTAPAVRRMRLGPLSETAVRALAAPAGIDPVRLARITGGNPFLVTEVIAAGEEMPASVRDATLARAGRLSGRARDVVEAAAVIGQRVAPGTLEAVAPGSGAGLGEALARGVLVHDGATLGFRHELVRAAIESSIPAHRRTELHGRVVAALEGMPETDDHARLAHHAELAGMVDAACRHAVIAADEAERVSALREAGLQAQRALRLGRSLSDPDRFELLLQASRTANFASAELDEPLAPAEEAVALARRLGDPVREGRALVALAGPLWSLDRVTEARAAAEHAVAVLEQTPDRAALGRAHATHIRMLATAFDPAAALTEGSRALAAATAAGLEATRIDLEVSLGLARGHLGDPAAGAALVAALRDARAAGLPIPTVRCCVNRVYVAVMLRQHALVDDATREAAAVLDEHQATIPRNVVELYRARSLLDRGRWDEALAIATLPDRALAAEVPMARAMVAIVAVRRGELGARERLDHAWQDLRDVSEGSRHVAIQALRIEAAWIEGDHDAARRLLAAARAAPAARWFARPAGDLALWAARLGMASEVPGGAPDAVALELAGDWRRAVAAWRRASAPYEAALAALPGDDRAAREAVGLLHRLGADAAARAFGRERAALGSRVPRGPRPSTRAHPAGLTRREQEVLEQLATGSTNPGIAAALHISERTAAHHVAAILGKLGTVDRRDAVQQARERGLLAPR
ncbi:AAA family ATPase [Baekduia soli]|uniref:AAA family ATPase n=1 Tax=Baekduia soli TaxID=496014 RepID=A0A5B8UB93_9ACTN|nr:LuxR family transcriptional regulator [Baekduia soli]QEC49891.1 AAA family ATPase [Baekduia soli]